MPIAWLLACAAFLVAWSWFRLLASGQPSPDLGALRFPLDWLGASLYGIGPRLRHLLTRLDTRAAPIYFPP